MADRWQKCWDVAPEIYLLLKESESLEAARDVVVGYLQSLDWTRQREAVEIDPWDYVLFKEAVEGLKNLFSPRNERAAKTSSLEYLWEAAVSGDSKVADGFVDEFFHLFKAVKVQADVYPSMLMEGMEVPDFERYEGREAAERRSLYLDEMGRRMDGYLARYRSGLDPDIAEAGAQNKARILSILGGDEEEWSDWRWQFRNVFKDADGLALIKEIIRLSPEHEESIPLALEKGIPFGVTPHYLSLMDRDPGDLDFALRQQVFPPLRYVQKMIAHRVDRKWAFDFMREYDTSPADLVTRRYPRVAIIKPYDSCPQICVYCQRNWEITAPFMPSAMASVEKIEAALDWYADHDQMMDVLVTGGDPLVMADDRIDRILGRLAEMDQIVSIRIATRTPITVPQRITEELCEIFGSYHDLGRRSLSVVTHFMHPREVTRDTLEAIRRIRVLGMDVYNQQVFTFANSRRFETAALRIVLKKIGVDPYYTFNMKGKSEMEEYSVPIARILQEQKEEARLLPGIFRTDEPVFNVPFLGKDHLRAWQNHEIIAIQPDGRRTYRFLPWEKNIVQVKPYIYDDVSISRYLERLRERGEDPQDYRSIWYYY
ncbi:KamA family radical SAM protein [Candidatus Methanocrinis natronophilus]|uniref:KamA family radical SAM protein n=1 Tax=Candidatus Methanocrinis natronophilus TaxID=3033396 RepID=A0ABT5X9N6_9EURY|nr:KamA family radical SAM protein [Candidatus Methanocrinis natronophilus]MDF0591424.1 KamA family radical SAM protein [Candidatus Methanocrinis natronophilus]